MFECGLPAALAVSTAPIAAYALYLVFGFHAVVFGVVLRSLRQELTPPELRGRVESAYQLIDKGAAAPGALLGGLLADRFGITAPFWLHALAIAMLIPFLWQRFSEASLTEARRPFERGRG